MGIVVSLSWFLVLKRIGKESESIESFLKKFEYENGFELLHYQANYLQQKSSKFSVTSLEAIIPFIFQVLFIIILSYLLKR